MFRLSARHKGAGHLASLLGKTDTQAYGGEGKTQLEEDGSSDAMREIIIDREEIKISAVTEAERRC
ncbi:hypothetical protein E2C01_102170 [Portunus trituberculatus]|uniref:Uncharacterized protein n=1 Tax=Portunus trituberculatus TaxID=210409 RepID=A0A5B7K7F9_PORTR|nr:hypothetical protein [Portunus trituberculatus]